MHKNMNNIEVSELLKAVSCAYTLDGEEKNRFKIIAYDRASSAIEHLSSEIKDIWDEGKLEEIPGVGQSIATYLDQIFSIGKSVHLQKIVDKYPKCVYELVKLNGVGPKTALKLSKAMNIKKDSECVEKLRSLIKNNKLPYIEGMGKESLSEILKSIDEYEAKKDKPKRMLLPYAQEIAEDIIAWMREEKKSLKLEPLGSLRRHVSTIGDIDIACATHNPLDVIRHFTNYPKTKRSVEKGESSASIMITSNIRVDLMTSKPESFGSMLQHLTGSKHHNIALREYANKIGLSVSEYGVKNLSNNKTKKFKNEKDLYNTLGLDYIPPELREDVGEIEMAKKHAIPKLVELADIKSDLQIHSNYDIETSHDIGNMDFDEIALRAKDKGYEYVAITDHNPSRSKHSDKQIISILKERKKEIDKFNTSVVKTKDDRVIYLYNSLEVDILPNGELAIPDEALNLLDFALVSIHSAFRLTKNNNTSRILKALGKSKVKIFAHPTGRKLQERESIEADWHKIFKYCESNNIIIEINAEPTRLDLPDYLIREANNYNLMFSLGTDAHNAQSLDNMVWGVSTARRGFLTKKRIVNCLEKHAFDRLIGK